MTTNYDTTNIRKAYTSHKEQQEKIIDEASKLWVENNVILITEKINRNNVNRLISSITKFEETFGPYRNSIPSLTTVLDGAEHQLQLVLTGKAGDKRSSDLLEYLSFVYNVFSSFFSKDLPILLKTKVFSGARENPDVRLDALSNRGINGVQTNFDADIAAKALAHGMTPSKEETKLVGRILRSKAMPKLDYKKISYELLGLTYNNLVELTSITKTPLVTTPGGVVEDEDGNKSINESRVILAEATAEELGARVDQLKKLVSVASGMKALVQPVNNLHSALLKMQNTPVGKQILDKIEQGLLTGDSMTDLVKTPAAKLYKQANMVIELFAALGKAWPKVKSFVDKNDPTPDDIENIKGILSKAVSGGFLKRTAQQFGLTIQPYPGLSPEEVVNALTTGQTTGTGDPVVQQQEGVAKLASPMISENEVDQQQQGASESKAALDNLKSSMQALSKFATTAPSGGSTAGTKETTGTLASQDPNTGGGGATQGTVGTDNKGVTGTDPNQQNLDSGPKDNASGDNDVINTALQAIGKSGDKTAQKQMQTVLQSLRDSGYTITKG